LPVTKTAPFEGMQIVEGRALGRSLFGWEEGIERGTAARATEWIDPEQALVDQPDRE
jgi:hypothetical protein